MSTRVRSPDDPAQHKISLESEKMPILYPEIDVRGFEKLPASKTPLTSNTSVLLQRAIDTQVNLQEELIHVPIGQFFENLSALVLLLKSKDIQLYRHSRRVQYLSLHLARTLDLLPDEELMVGLAALLHDIGKIAIDDELLQKPGRLSGLEYDEVKEHATFGALILRRYSMMERLISFVYHHHERWDGFGYPMGLQGEVIPPGARIVAIADAFDAMTSYRAYSLPRTPEQAQEELHRCAGTQFDPSLVENFSRMLKSTPPRSQRLKAPASATSLRL